MGTCTNTLLKTPLKYADALRTDIEAIGICKHRKRAFGARDSFHSPAFVLPYLTLLIR